MDILKRIGGPYFLQVNVFNSVFGRDASMSKTHIENVTIGTNNGALGIGSDQTITNVSKSNQLDELTAKLIQELKAASIPPEAKQQLEEAINEAVKQAKLEKPNKLTLTGIVGIINTAMLAITNSPKLIEVYDKWHAFFGPLLGS